MNLQEIEKEFRYLFNRSVDDGVRVWKQSVVEKTLKLNQSEKDLGSQEIQSLFEKFESEGLIKLIRRPDAYLIVWQNAPGLTPIEEEYRRTLSR